MWGALLWIITFSAILIAPTLQAAEIGIIGSSKGVDFISIKGEIKKGDSERFQTLIEGRNRIVVILESPGGLIHEALSIGAIIRTRNLSTAVESDKECFSACGLIWLAGARRYMSPNSLIGFHAAYRKEAGEFRESGVANAEIGSFLTHLGLRIEAIRFFTIAGPNDFLLLSPKRARALGIDIFVFGSSHVDTPFSAPTGDRHAERWVLYNMLRLQCQNYFNPNIGVINLGKDQAFSEGVKILGAESWINIWTQVLEQWASQKAIKGLIGICIEAEKTLREQGLKTGISGPSFPCSKAAALAERAICADPNLWAKDRAMNAIYLWIRKNVKRDLRKNILAVQRAWLSIRNDCGANRRCLNHAYDQRLHELKSIVVE